MAVQALPTIQTIFSGDGITSSTRNFQFTLGEKIENVLYVKSTDGDVSIDFSRISNLASFNFYSADTFYLKLTVDIGTVETPNEVEIPFQVSGMFRLDPYTNFLSKIKAVKISTDSTTDITVDIRIYGGAS